MVFPAGADDERMSQTTTATHDGPECGAEDPDDPGPSAADADQPPEPDRDPDDPAPGAAPAISVAADPGADADAAWIADALGRAVAEVERATGRAIARVTVRIVGDAAMTTLHERWRGEAGTTDVLTFPASGEGEPVTADIAVCADEAARRAGALGHPAEREMLLYALHGVLHCTGFDDHDPEACARMHAEEDRILEAIGVGATYGARAADVSDGGRVT
jgi:probable rRNA maturation factor